MIIIAISVLYAMKQTLLLFGASHSFSMSIQVKYAYVRYGLLRGRQII